MGSQRPPRAALYLLGVLGEYPAGASARVPGLGVQGRNARSSLGLALGPHVASLEHHGGLGPPESLSVLTAPAPLSAPLSPRPAPHVRFPLALWGAWLDHSRRHAC